MMSGPNNKRRYDRGNAMHRDTKRALQYVLDAAPVPPENPRALAAHGNLDAWFKKYERWFNRERATAADALSQKR